MTIADFSILFAALVILVALVLGAIGFVMLPMNSNMGGGFMCLGGILMGWGEKVILDEYPGISLGVTVGILVLGIFTLIFGFLKSKKPSVTPDTTLVPGTFCGVCSVRLASGIPHKKELHECTSLGHDYYCTTCGGIKANPEKHEQGTCR